MELIPKSHLKIIREIDKEQNWNKIEFKLKIIRGIKDLPRKGLFWLWTNYDLDEFEEWDREVGTIPAARLIRMTKGFKNKCRIEKEGFRLVFIGDFIEGEITKGLYDVIINQFYSSEITWGSLGILHSPQNDISRWRVSSSSISEATNNQLNNSNFKLGSLAYLWRMEFGTPVFNHWLWCE